MIKDLANTPSVATESAREVLNEQAENLEITEVSLPGRQAAEFGRRSIQNFVGSFCAEPTHQCVTCRVR
jgi:hypothetical protein